jgi:hypothetical protein
MDDMTYPDKPRKQGPDSVLVMGSIFTRLRTVFPNSMDITLAIYNGEGDIHEQKISIEKTWIREVNHP